MDKIIKLALQCGVDIEAVQHALSHVERMSERELMVANLVLNINNLLKLNKMTDQEAKQIAAVMGRIDEDTNGIADNLRAYKDEVALLLSNAGIPAADSQAVLDKLSAEADRLDGIAKDVPLFKAVGSAATGGTPGTAAQTVLAPGGPVDAGIDSAKEHAANGAEVVDAGTVVNDHGSVVAVPAADVNEPIGSTDLSSKPAGDVGIPGSSSPALDNK